MRHFRFARVLPILPLAFVTPLRAGVSAAPDRIVPVVTSAPGASGSAWRTTLVLHNPSEAESRVELTFHAAGAESIAADPLVTVTLSPGETRVVADVVKDLFRLYPASGSLDVKDAGGSPAAIFARVFSEAAGGETVGLSVPVARPSEALQAGERAVLPIPGSGFRHNVGARALSEGVVLSFTARDASGVVRGTGRRTLGRDAFLQLAAAEFVGSALPAAGVIGVEVVSGAAFVYGTPVDDRTNDGSFESAARVSPAAPAIDWTSDFTPPAGRVGDAQGGPGVMRLMTATSRDGLAFTRTGLIVTDQGDVPDLLVDSKGIVYLYYVGWTVGTERNKVVVALSKDSGKTWIYKKAVLEGFEATTSDPVDPDVLLLADGTFRLYVTCAERGESPRTYYLEGTDGVHFTKRGLAFAPASGEALDPSTVRIGGTTHLFNGGVPGSNLHATSTDGRTFTAVSNLTLKRDGVGQLMANGISVSGGARFYTFDNVPPTPGGASTIGSAFSADGFTWTVEPGARLTMDATGGKESLGVKDPAVTLLPDGSALMVYSTRIP